MFVGKINYRQGLCGVYILNGHDLMSFETLRP